MRASKHRPVVIAVTSDQHCGSSVALCPRRIRLDDGGEYLASKAQLWLDQCWREFWDEADAVRRALKAELFAVFNGDFVEGNHHGTTQILSGNPTAQAAVVDACIKVPLALNPDRLWVVRGTAAHVGESACHEERIAKGLVKDGRPVVCDEETDTASHWHVRMEVQGVRLDFAHHDRVGIRPWTKANVTSALAAEIFYNHAADEIPYPHLAVRSHMHQFVDTGDAHPTRVLQTGAFQLKTGFTHRIDTSGKLAHIGGYLLVIDGGEAVVKKLHFKPEPTPLWRA